jgi:hypothetical protein
VSAEIAGPNRLGPAGANGPRLHARACRSRPSVLRLVDQLVRLDPRQ